MRIMRTSPFKKTVHGLLYETELENNFYGKKQE